MPPKKAKRCFSPSSLESPSRKRGPITPYIKFSELPLEVVQLIFDFVGRLDYWSYRLFRSIADYQKMLDGKYLVLIDRKSPAQLFKIPRDQTINDHSFRTIKDFQKNLKKHFDAYQCRKRFVFVELDISSDETIRLIEEVVRHLNSQGVEFSFFWKRNKGLGKLYGKFSDRFRFNLFSDELLPGDSQIILDEWFASYYESAQQRGEDLRKGHMKVKFLEYSEDLKIEFDVNSHNCVRHSWCAIENVVLKQSVQNLKRLEVQYYPRPFTSINIKLFYHLRTLILHRCVSPGRKLTMINMNFPFLEDLTVQFSNLSKFNGNKCPLLKSLKIIDPAREFLCQDEDDGDRMKQLSFNLKIKNNQLTSLQIFIISTMTLNQVYLNNFGESLEFLDLCVGHVDDSGSLGDLPHLVSISDTVLLYDMYKQGESLLPKLVCGLDDSNSIKRLRILDYYTKDLQYLADKKFPNLELLKIEALKSGIISALPKFKMPSLKAMNVSSRCIQNIDITGLTSLEFLIFIAGTKESLTPWTVGEKYEISVIDFKLIPQKYKTNYIDVRYHSAKTYSKLPSSFDQYNIKSEFDRFGLKK